MNPRELIEAYGLKVDQELRDWFTSFRAPMLPYFFAEYHLGWRDEHLNDCRAPQGKMLRPLLVLLTYQVFQEDFSRILPFAAACELYHNHTLVFDDIQDGDKFRRDRPTVWNLWGIGQGVNTGLVLGYLSQIFILKLREKKFSDDKIFSLLEAFNEMTLELAEGQSLDLDFETREKVSPEEYLVMIGKKTGALIGVCTFGGAFLSQDDAHLAQKFKQFGRKLGTAMQIRDDLVGIWGETKDSGKEPGQDLWRRKKTFPVLKAMSFLSGENLNFVKDYYASNTAPSKEIIQKIVKIFDDAGVREQVVENADYYLREAFDLLQQSVNHQQKALDSLLNFSKHAFEAIGTLRQPVPKS
jgi:geranylgeranyl diphosphate synthase type I